MSLDVGNQSLEVTTLENIQPSTSHSVHKPALKRCYPAKGTLVNPLHFSQVQLTVKGGKCFIGRCGGDVLATEHSFYGKLYCQDINALYKETVRFEHQCTPAYFSIVFYDKNDLLIGHFHAHALSSETINSGGKGTWF